MPFHVDHVIAEKHRGETVLENLAWACFSCNMHKGPNIAGIDPVTGETVRLFRPIKTHGAPTFAGRALGCMA